MLTSDDWPVIAGFVQVAVMMAVLLFAGGPLVQVFETRTQYLPVPAAAGVTLSVLDVAPAIGLAVPGESPEYH
jgi:hypothetical protein